MSGEFSKTRLLYSCQENLSRSLFATHLLIAFPCSLSFVALALCNVYESHDYEGIGV